jgi:hypothetical protein
MYTLENLYQELSKLTPEQRQQPARILGEKFNQTIDSVWILNEDHINPTSDGWEPKSVYAQEEGYDDEPIVGKTGDIYLTCIPDRVFETSPTAADQPKPPLPTTLNEAIDYLLPRFQGMEEYMKDGENVFAAFCHSQLSGGIGMQIRNELQLWVHESPIHQHFLADHQLFHPDEMSDLIIRHVYRKMASASAPTQTPEN